MSNELRRGAVKAIIRGLGTAVMVTVPGILLLALLVVYAQLSDGGLTALNQALKLGAVFAGAWAAVGRGGTRGLALGAAVGLLYIALGYGVCALWDELLISGPVLAMEFLLGALLGGVSGALAANLPARGGRMRRRTA
ncbi:MAG: TIGR04086 family membrane protein [Clostridia bacterium]|nr:TIGR04086 family membrane protein [Clostridia bacterium]